MANITLDGLPAKTGTISDSGILHLRESGVDKKVTVSAFLSKISAQYQTFMNTFLGTADKAAARAALDIARRTAVSNADYTILVTDKVVAQTGSMSAARTFTLPAASAFPAGEELIIQDDSGSVTSTNKISIARAGSDTIDGLTSKDITLAYGFVKLISDGTSKWKVTSSLNVKLAGDIVQVVNTQTGAVATGTTAIPIDDTIPQNTEGSQFMSLAVTPTSATNILQIDVVLNIAAAVGCYGCLALFQDSNANAIATCEFDLQAGYTSQAVLRHRMTAGTTSSTTFKVRAGGNNTTTYTFNGQSGGRLFGGTLASSITITEINA